MFWLVDTPGFDDSKRSDYEILRELVTWLIKSYSDNIQLTGIIYLHRILDVRLGGTAMRNLRMFKKLVGQDNLGSIILATTFWGSVDNMIGIERENQLMTTDEFWGGMIKKGSWVFRHDQQHISGQQIISYLLDRNQRSTYRIQREMVDQRKTLDQTAAGAEVQEQVEKLRLKYEAELETLRDEMREAIKTKDFESQKEIEKIRKEHEAWIRRQEIEQQKAQARAEELWQTREAEREQSRKAAKKQLKELNLQLQKMREKAARRRYGIDAEMQAHIDRQQEEIRRWREAYENRTRCIVM